MLGFLHLVSSNIFQCMIFGLFDVRHLDNEPPVSTQTTLEKLIMKYCLTLEINSTENMKICSNIKSERVLNNISLHFSRVEDRIVASFSAK